MPASPGLFSFATATSWALSPPRPTGVSNTSARSKTSLPGGPPSTCWRRIAAHSTPFACSSHQLPSLAALACRQRSGIHEQSVQAVLLGNGHHQFTTTNTPQQNGVPECVGRTLCSMVRCLLVDSGLPPKLCGKLMLTTPYLCKRMPHSGLNM